MAEDGQLVRLAGRSIPDDAALAELLDPIALEERLREARVRRTEALARRGGGTAPAEGSASVPPADHRPAPLVAAPEERTAPPPAAARRVRALPLMMFLAGAGLGAALVAVAAMPSLRLRLAMMLAPEAVVLSEPAPPPSVSSSAPPAPALPPEAPPAAAPVAAPVATPVATPTAPAAPTEPETAAQPAPEAAAPAMPAPVAPEAAAVAPEEPPVAAAALPPRIVLHYPVSAEAEALAVRDRLLADGATDVEIVPVRIAIGRTNVRFYHDADADGARALASLIAPAGAPAPEARDFTDYPNPVATGKVEVWFAGGVTPGRASAARPPAPAPVAAPGAGPAMSPIASPAAGPVLTPSAAPGPNAAGSPAAAGAMEPLELVPPETQAEAVARILVERTYQRLRGHD